MLDTLLYSAEDKPNTPKKKEKKIPHTATVSTTCTELLPSSTPADVPVSNTSTEETNVSATAAQPTTFDLGHYYDYSLSPYNKTPVILSKYGTPKRTQLDHSYAFGMEDNPHVVKRIRYESNSQSLFEESDEMVLPFQEMYDSENEDKHSDEEYTPLADVSDGESTENEYEYDEDTPTSMLDQKNI